jgi:hypothetical protein
MAFSVVGNLRLDNLVAIGMTPAQIVAGHPDLEE